MSLRWIILGVLNFLVTLSVLGQPKVCQGPQPQIDDCDDISHGLKDQGEQLSQLGTQALSPEGSKPLGYKEKSLRQLKWQRSLILIRSKALNALINYQEDLSKDLQVSSSDQSQKNQGDVRALGEILREQRTGGAQELTRFCEQKGCGYSWFKSQLRDKGWGEREYHRLLARYEARSRQGQCSAGKYAGPRGVQVDCSLRSYMDHFNRTRALELEKRAMIEANPILELAEPSLVQESQRGESHWEFSQEQIDKVTTAVATDHSKLLLSRLKEERRALKGLFSENARVAAKLEKYTGSMGGVRGRGRPFESQIKGVHRKLVEISNRNTGFLRDLIQSQDEESQYATYGEAYCSAHGDYMRRLNLEEQAWEDDLFFVPGVGMVAALRKRRQCQTLDFRFSLKPSPKALAAKQKCWEEFSDEIKIAIATSLGGGAGVLGATLKRAGKKGSKAWAPTSKMERAQRMLGELDRDPDLARELNWLHPREIDLSQEAERLAKAEGVLGRPLSESEKVAIIRAHKLCERAPDTTNQGIIKHSRYSDKCMAYKAAVLRAELESRPNVVDRDVKRLIKENVAGMVREPQVNYVQMTNGSALFPGHRVRIKSDKHGEVEGFALEEGWIRGTDPDGNIKQFRVSELDPNDTVEMELKGRELGPSPGRTQAPSRPQTSTAQPQTLFREKRESNNDVYVPGKKEFISPSSVEPPDLANRALSPSNRRQVKEAHSKVNSTWNQLQSLNPRWRATHREFSELDETKKTLEKQAKEASEKFDEADQLSRQRSRKISDRKDKYNEDIGRIEEKMEAIQKDLDLAENARAERADARGDLQRIEKANAERAQALPNHRLEMERYRVTQGEPMPGGQENLERLRAYHPDPQNQQAVLNQARDNADRRESDLQRALDNQESNKRKLEVLEARKVEIETEYRTDKESLERDGHSQQLELLKLGRERDSTATALGEWNQTNATRYQQLQEEAASLGQRVNELAHSLERQIRERDSFLD